MPSVAVQALTEAVKEVDELLGAPAKGEFDSAKPRSNKGCWQRGGRPAGQPL